MTAANLSSIDPTDVLVLMPCGGKKCDRAAAFDLYLGSMWQTLRSHLGAVPQAQVFVLSGKHGLISSYTQLERYEARLSAQRADHLIVRGAHAAFDGFGEGLIGMTPIAMMSEGGARIRRPYRAVLIAGAGDYARVLQAYVAELVTAGVVSVDAPICQVAGAIGEQRSQLGQWLDAINGEAELADEDAAIAAVLELETIEAPIAPVAEVETPGARAPLVVSYGVGVDSTAMLVGLLQRGERPDLILFADTGSEKPESYAYLPIINSWLDRVGFPRVTVVKNPRPKSGDKSLGEACGRLGVLPALAYGQHQCSLVWKRDPQLAFIKRWAPAIAAWSAGELVTMAIGYDAGPRDSCRSYKAEGKASAGYQNRFPLIAWGWDRERCKAEILAAGLPVPVKSACFFCPASTKTEIDWLAAFHPDLAAQAIELEERAIARGLRSVKGLGRRFAWRDHLAQREAAQ